MVSRQKYLKNAINRQLRVCMRGVDKALELQMRLEYFSDKPGVVSNLKADLCEVQALNQAKDALLMQYVTEYKQYEPITIRQIK